MLCELIIELGYTLLSNTSRLLKEKVVSISI